MAVYVYINCVCFKSYVVCTSDRCLSFKKFTDVFLDSFKWYKCTHQPVCWSLCAATEKPKRLPWSPWYTTGLSTSRLKQWTMVRLQANWRLNTTTHIVTGCWSPLASLRGFTELLWLTVSCRSAALLAWLTPLWRGKPARCRDWTTHAHVHTREGRGSLTSSPV